MHRGQRTSDTTSRKTKKRHYVEENEKATLCAEDEVDEKTECVTNMGEFTRAHRSAELATSLQAAKRKEGKQHQTFEPKYIAGSEQATLRRGKRKTTLRRGKRKSDTTPRKTKKRHYVAQQHYVAETAALRRRRECNTTLREDSTTPSEERSTTLQRQQRYVAASRHRGRPSALVMMNCGVLFCHYGMERTDFKNGERTQPSAKTHCRITCGNHSET